jgi:hypothetical protein
MPTAPYYLKDGSRVPGTTTIIQRFKESGGLMQWAFKQGQSGALRLYDEAEKAAEIGTVAHAMVEAFIDGKSEAECQQLARTLPPEAEPKVMSAFTAYKTWQSNFQVEIVCKEIHLVSEKYRYGGTPDAIGLVGAQLPILALLDWKTSNGIYTDYLIQLAAYKNLWEENFPERPLTGGSHLLRFAKEHGDFGHHYFADLGNAWRQFLLFREAYEIDKELKKRAA